jgi:O-antigen/teichoic acid export membrane protein
MSTTRGVAITAVGNALPPVALLVTQVLLAQSLGVNGRGTVAAATAPLMFAVAFLTLGLPEALTYLVAQRRGGRHIRQFVFSLAALLVAGLLGILCILLLARPLSVGNNELAHLMTIAVGALIPALWTGAMRGVAYGAQDWWLITAERSFSALLQLAVVGALFLTDSLTLLSSTLSIAAAPFVGAAVYLCSPRWWAILRGSASSKAGSPVVALVISYASRVWLGSAAGIILMRLDQVIMTPLAGVQQLGIYVVGVAVTSGVLLFSSTVRDVIFALESGEQSTSRVGRAARISTLVTALVAAIIAAASPWLIPLLFGPEFSGAIPVVVVLSLAFSLAVPGSVAGAALSARGRPELRSLTLSIQMVLFVIAMLLLVPPFGAVGAAAAMLAGAVAPAHLNIHWLHKYFEVPVSEFYRFRKSDFDVFYQAPAWLLARLRSNSTS